MFRAYSGDTYSLNPQIWTKHNTLEGVMVMWLSSEWGPVGGKEIFQGEQREDQSWQTEFKAYKRITVEN